MDRRGTEERAPRRASLGSQLTLVRVQVDHLNLHSVERQRVKDGATVLTSRGNKMRGVAQMPRQPASVAYTADR